MTKPMTKYPYLEVPMTSKTFKSNPPVIAGVEITTDAEGRFNLNALHKASGAEKRHGPGYWMALESTKELIRVLEQNLSDTEIPVSVVNIVKGGINQGTFAHELLAISYAGWISPAFQLQVNQTFLDYRTGKLTPAFTLPTNFVEALESLIASEKEKLVITAERDEAIRTKAQIGSRREAQAMAAASVAVRKRNKLEEQLARIMQSASIKAVQGITRIEYPWRPLRDYCESRELEPITCDQYGAVKPYPAEAWLYVHGVDLHDLFMGVINVE